MKNNLKSFKRFIVVDKETGKPMAFDDDQFCFCTSEIWQDEHFPLMCYTYSMAKKLITKSLAYRKRRELSATEYLLVPFLK